MAVAAPGLQKLRQLDFSAGAFPAEPGNVTVGLDRIPDNGCADIQNGLIDEDGSIFRRGGSTHFGTFAANPQADRPFQNLWSGYLGTVGQAVVASRLEGTTVVSERFWAMLPGDPFFETDFSLVWAGTKGPQRPVAYNGMVVFVGAPSPSGPGVQVAAWGGSRTATLTGQSVTLTKDSKTVTGAGTSWLTTVTPGMLLTAPGTYGDQIGVVERVISDTTLNLLRPWPSASGALSVDFKQVVDVTTSEEALPATSGPVFAASIAGRLVYARGNRISFSGPDDPLGTFGFDYHEVPYGASIVGLEPIRDQLLVFTTQGVYVVSNLAYGMTDPYGNPQQRMERVAPDVVLWDNLGVASWRGSVVAPCADDVYLIDSASSPHPIGGGIRRLYRAYVKAGYQTGQATVFDGRYLLPILNLNTGTRTPGWVDTLVCNLQTGAWTRWGDYGGTVRGFASKVGDQTRQPQILSLGLSGANPRVQDISSAFTPTATVKNDADGSTHKLRVMTRTFDLGDLVKRQWRRVRLRYELSDAASDDPRIEAYSEVDRLSPVQQDLVDDASEGEQVYTWRVSRRARGIRFQFTQWNATSSARFRGLEVFYRPTGRR